MTIHLFADDTVDTREVEKDVVAAEEVLSDGGLDIEPSIPSATDVRTDIVRKFAAFTATRLSRAPPPTDDSDPFAAASTSADFASTPREFIPSHPPRRPFPGPSLRLQLRIQFRAAMVTTGSPTPRPGRGAVFYQQPAEIDASPRKQQRPPLEYWSPHPARGRSCAVAIKAPPPTSRAGGRDKENVGVV